MVYKEQNERGQFPISSSEGTKTKESGVQDYYVIFLCFLLLIRLMKKLLYPSLINLCIVITYS
jgi:hypothetical protein